MEGLKAQIQVRGSSVEEVEAQLLRFKAGTLPLSLDKACTPAEGVLRLEEEQIDSAIACFERERVNKALLKFVPASGAATRMFKSLFEFQENGMTNKEVETLERHWAAFPFSRLVQKEALGERISDVLEESGLSYGSLPKGLVHFHAYADELRTAFQEHLVEGVLYGESRGEVHIHFTVSDAAMDVVKKHLEAYSEKLAKKQDVNFKLTFSTQQASTDTIAVTENNEPFQEEDGTFLFRPGGHGALLHNLNALHADVVFIKNIDNVVIDEMKPVTVRYKKALAGLLMQIQARVFELLKSVDAGQFSVDEALAFVQQELCVSMGTEFDSLPKEEQTKQLIQLLNRPIRVCGMVKNQGEPGGGPFWVKSADGNTQLQIVEKAQIDLTSTAQKACLEASTHFNPVDLVCGIKDYKGEAFDLLQFSDPDTAFISEKTHKGRKLKALEHPGLWNGAMANWNTIFVEVPLETFNPVKSFSDLLRPAHQVSL